VGQSWTYTYTLTGKEAETQWVVEWRGQREGREIGQTVPLGPGGSGEVSLPLPDEWLVRFALVALPIVAALASERLATLGALGTVAFAGMLRLLGIWELPVVLWFAALVIALGGHALTIERRGGAVG
jgi:hypothetical protein